MGLDGLEMVMELEESFGVELTESDVEKAETPAIMCDVIYGKLRVTDKTRCLTQRAFYVLRRALMEILELKREEVTLDLRFRDFVPKQIRKKFWNQLQSATKARRFPDLARPWWLTLLMTAIGLALFIVCAGSFGYLPATALIIVFSIVCAKLTRPFRIYISWEFKTVRDLVPAAMASNEVEWTREQVSGLVKKIVIEQLGISEIDYSEDASFVKDYRML